MSLEDLTQYASTQTDAINRLIQMGRFTTGPISDAWAEFKESVWKKGLASVERQEPVERDDDPVDEEEAPPDTIPVSALVTPIPASLPKVWDSYSQRILVRSEYHEAEQTVLSANGNNKAALLIAGQPGIGKTFFLLWLLIRRLALGLPTALQISQDYALLFHEGGVCQFTDLGNYKVYDSLLSLSPSKIWALVDSNWDLGKPTGVFNSGRLFFTVQAASPRHQRVQWLENVNSQYFYMKGWTLSEFLQARLFLGLSAPYTEQQLYRLHWGYAAPPRAMARYARNEAAYAREITGQARYTTVEGVIPATRSPYFDGCFDPLVVMEPSPTSRADWVRATTPARLTLDIYVRQYCPYLFAPPDLRSWGSLFEPR